ncbi:MAG: tRNA pseudouridine(55) synthase TruB [Flavobacteriaceae bacterium]|nr:tRNA pseudouridine(55) synthase TruB [Flavobacteriaceae bacterium]|tara:strand:- start:12615 stop:13307 length:693 start_codon:yes stop_codon:yes gene_type:complete
MEYLLDNKSIEEILNGAILIVDKPQNWSSFDVVKKIRNTITQNYKIKKIKIGHAGTLDPLATGLLIICTGKMTKEISKLQNQLKVYTGTFVLGSTTPSFDLESKIDNFYKINHIDKNLINKVLPNFIGDIYQTPPIYSAIKKKGKRLYELAREGKKTEIKARKVFVEKFEITKIKLPEIDFLIKCGKGTYIRSIANDFGKALNSGAHLKSLRRISSGKYLVKNAIKFTFN